MPEPRKTIFRSLGEFFGHVRHGLKTDLTRRQVLRHEVQQEERGNITLRRTIIEEVEINPAAQSEQHDPPASPPEPPSSPR